LDIRNSGVDTIPALGSYGGSLGITVGSGHGLLVGGLGTGSVFQQVQRIDGTVAAYNLLLQPTAGNVGIGTTGPLGKLDVNGTIFQRGASLHADYVFEPAYKLESIEDHSAYMWQNKHLKAVPVAAKDGEGQDIVNWGERNRGVLEELEKAHVYIQQLNERMKVLEARLAK